MPVITCNASASGPPPIIIGLSPSVDNVYAPAPFSPMARFPIFSHCDSTPYHGTSAAPWQKHSQWLASCQA